MGTIIGDYVGTTAGIHSLLSTRESWASTARCTIHCLGSTLAHFFESLKLSRSFFGL